MFVAHGPRGELNNSPDNISYKTPAQNKADELRDGTRYLGEDHHWSKKIPEAFWKRWNAGERKSDLYREYGVSRQLVHRRLKSEVFYRPEFAGALEGLILGG